MNTVAALFQRGVFALLLAAFLVPTPTPSPADEVRALYAAQGLLCDTDSEGQRHHEAHCVLCVLPAAGSAEENDVSGPLLATGIIVDFPAQPILRLIATKSHRARAPPNRIV